MHGVQAAGTTVVFSTDTSTGTAPFTVQFTDASSNPPTTLVNQITYPQGTTNSSCTSCGATIQPKVFTSPVETGDTLKMVQNTKNPMKGIMIVSVSKGDLTAKDSRVATSYSIDHVLIRKNVTAYPQKNSDFSLNEFDNLPAIEILDQNNAVIYSTKFSYQQIITVPMQMPGQIDDKAPSQIRITPFTTLVLPYLLNGQKIRIVDENGHVADTVSLESYGIIDQSPVFKDIESTPWSQGSFNLLILASGYTPAEMYKFTNRATLVENIIRTAEPFKSNNSLIAVNIYSNTRDVGCYTGCYGIDRLLCCNETKVILAAADSGKFYDEIIVIHNTATYAGGGYRDYDTYKTNSYSSFGAVYDGPYSDIMSLHEFGHSFGDLCDEYSYGTEGYTYYPCVNCRASCSEWSSFSSICTLGCDARSDFFRPNNSVMFSLGYRSYNQASINAEYSPDGLEKRLNFFVRSGNVTLPDITIISPAANQEFTTATVPVSGTASDNVGLSKVEVRVGLGSWQTATGTTLWNTSVTLAPGSNTITARATNTAGNTKDASVTVTYTAGGGPVANFSGTPTSGTVPLPVQFSDASTGSPTGWAWFFGDETYTQAWTQQTASAGWSARFGQSSVVNPDGSIVLMGGEDNNANLNDTWRSTDNGATWTLMNASSGWPARVGHTSVSIPDGSIVLMGGADDSFWNDTWRSTDNGATWTLMNASSGWPGRYYHTSVAMPDGSIVLMGGRDDSSRLVNDTWRSTDNGTTWTLMKASSGWSGRNGHTAVAMPDGSIILMGGYDGTNTYNDTWKSTDNGATWALVNANSGWPTRQGHTAVAMPDGSIVLMGGYAAPPLYNDTWRSTDKGATWALVNASYGWLKRLHHTSVAMPDGSIVLMGGTDADFNFFSNVWRFQPAGSSLQNPSHTYTHTGTYNVALTATNSAGSNLLTRTNYITVTAVPPVSSSKIGLFRTGNFFLASNNTPCGGNVNAFNYGQAGDVPLAGDWNGYGAMEVGIFRTGIFFLAGANAPGGGTVTAFNFGMTDDVPLAGDWNGDGTMTVGIFRNGTFYLASSNIAGGGTVTAFNFGMTGDEPVAGDWNGDGTTNVGIFRNGTFYLASSNIAGGGTVTAFNFGQTGDVPVAGDWNADGKTEAGIFRNGTVYLASSNSFGGGVVTAFNFGQNGDEPVAGRWSYG
jgi:PKD repeat protein